MHALAVLWFLQLRKTAVPGNLGCAAHQPSPFQVFRMFRGFSQRVESLSGPPSVDISPTFYTGSGFSEFLREVRANFAANLGFSPLKQP
jgi:hypothetical protein